MQGNGCRFVFFVLVFNTNRLEKAPEATSQKEPEELGNTRQKIKQNGDRIIKNEILVVLRIKNPYFDLFCTVWEGFGWYFETEVSLKKWTTFGMLFCPRHDSLRVLRRGSPWS